MADVEEGEIVDDDEVSIVNIVSANSSRNPTEMRNTETNVRNNRGLRFSNRERRKSGSVNEKVPNPLASKGRRDRQEKSKVHNNGVRSSRNQSSHSNGRRNSQRSRSPPDSHLGRQSRGAHRGMNSFC